MNILVLYALAQRKTRKTIVDSIYCFSKYDKKNHYYFLNIMDISSVKKLSNMSSSKYERVSAVIVHYSAMAQRFDPVWWENNKELLFTLLKQYKCAKIIIPQDEYNYNGYTREFIEKAGIQYIYTCASEEDYEKFYPKELNYKKIETVFTGYIDEDTLKKVNELGYDKKRDIDIGYRARKGRYWLGRHGQLKSKLVEAFVDYLKDQSGITYDIENTKENNENVFLGDAWIEYLLRCRTVLGCLGGSSLLDKDGSIARNVDAYCMEHPDATFEEVEDIYFKGMDNGIHLFALSPRHFECAMTKTCQVLVEGNYGGVFEANTDYIELKEDFSNIGEVVEKIRDVEYCKQIAENCYKHVVLSGKYTYAKFVEYIIGNIEVCDSKRQGFLLKLWMTCKLSKLYIVINPLTQKISMISASGRSGRVSFSNILHFIYNLFKVFLIRALGKIFKAFEPYKDKKWHKFLKRKWDEHLSGKK